jgi:signal transduction histidine kinase/ActR/RegA family two-component response regulator
LDLNFLNNHSIKNSTTALSVLLVVLAMGVAATGFSVLKEARNTDKTWRQYEAITARKADHLSHLRAAIGYGGAIHKFKNFVLRQDRLLIVDVHASMLEVTVALTAYSALGANAAERNAISVLEKSLSLYLAAIEKAELLASTDISPRAIDRIVKINDGPALAALATLASELRAAREKSSKSVHTSVAQVESAITDMISIVGALTALLVIGFFWFSRIQFVNPLLQLSDAISSLAKGDTATPIPHGSRQNELGALARTMEVFRENMVFRQHAEHELRQIQKELEERTEAAVLARNEAEEANTAKSRFLSSMSHELRTPLNAILGFTQLLNMDLDQALTAKQRDATDQILKAGDHLMTLIGEVLDLAAIEAGKASLDLKPQDPTPIIEECVAFARTLAEQKDLTFHDRTTGWRLPDFDIDDTRFRQVLLNLLSNAVKYNRDGGTVTLAIQKIDEQKIRFNVIDSGIGIAAEKHAGIFMPFSRLGLENSDITGTGIGLTITKELVEAMGGTIGFESALGLGSTFWIEFPVVRGELSVKERREEIEDTARTGPTVLCVEDNASSLKLLESIIERIPGSTMLAAHTGEIGLDLAEMRQPDIILMDINLPGIDGVETLKRLKETAATKDIPVIAVTARAAPEDKRQGLEAGFTDYLTKPIDVEAITAAINQAFE